MDKSNLSKRENKMGVKEKTGMDVEMSSSNQDEELERLLSKQEQKIKVIGVGGAGNNTITRMSEVGIRGTEMIAVNTDAQDLLYSESDKKILIGRELTEGLGGGNDPSVGREAAKENKREIKEALKGADMVFITCGLGGGTGTGASPIIAEVAKSMGALTIGVVTLPFTVEGKKRQENAKEGLEWLEPSVDTLIVIPNDKLLKIAPDLPLHTAFKVADEVLTNAVKGIAEMITKTGLVNTDFADVRTIMGGGGVAMIGVGESDTENRAKESVEKALNNPLLDIEIQGAKGALVNISGGPDMALDEAHEVFKSVSERMDQDVEIIWGAYISDDLKDTIRTMLIVTGVESPQIYGKGKSYSEKKREEMEDQLQIEFIR